VNVYFDDIFIVEETIEMHDRTLNKVIKRDKQFNIKFNSKKLQYKVSKVKFLEFILSAGGVTEYNNKCDKRVLLQPQGLHFSFMSLYLYILLSIILNV